MSRPRFQCYFHEPLPFRLLLSALSSVEPKQRRRNSLETALPVEYPRVLQLDKNPQRQIFHKSYSSVFQFYYCFNFPFLKRHRLLNPATQIKSNIIIIFLRTAFVFLPKRKALIHSRQNVRYDLLNVTMSVRLGDGFKWPRATRIKKTLRTTALTPRNTAHGARLPLLYSVFNK